MKIVRKIEDGQRETIIEDKWESSATTAKVVIGGRNSGGNSSCYFELEIEGGQIWEGKIEMAGEWERDDFTKLLKQILVELELIDQK